MFEKARMAHLDDVVRLVRQPCAQVVQRGELVGSNASGELQEHGPEMIPERLDGQEKIPQRVQVRPALVGDRPGELEAEPEPGALDGASPGGHRPRIRDAVEGRVALDGVEYLYVAGQSRRPRGEETTAPARKGPRRQAKPVPRYHGARGGGQRNHPA